ncbi:MAG: ATP-dependent DNA helicase RecG [Candidatus Omnitrophota bacterium]
MQAEIKITSQSPQPKAHSPKRWVDTATTSARYIKGVGPQRLAMLKRLDIATVADCLNHFPARYEDRSNIKPISQLTDAEPQTFAGKILTSSIFRTKTGHTIFQLAISDDTASIYALWFNQPYMKKYFNKGDKVIMFGKVQRKGKLQIIHPEYEIIKDDEEDKNTKVHTGRIVPIYPLVSGINQRRLRSIMKSCIDQYGFYAHEYMPVDMQARNHMLDFKSAIKNIHFPVNERQRQEARRRLVFDEFLFLQLALALRRHKIKTETPIKSHDIANEFKQEFLKTLDFSLTKAQVNVIDEIENDMASTKPMHRLLQGEVGSGKTVISAYALALTANNLHQGIIMAPTEILAQQHYVTITKILSPLGIEVCLLVNDMPAKDKQKSQEIIRSGQAQVVVGTHTLIQEGINFKDLGLVVIDEQHKFGVEQRATFKNKGYNPHILVMSATPIPRTLAMCVYGDMDISVLDELPLGPRNVETYLIQPDELEKVYEFLKQEIAKGRQGYIISPVIEKSLKLEIEGAEKLFETLTQKFDKLKLGLMHGRLKADQKTKTMAAFKKGKIDILVCTTVVEVGIDVPNATVMIVNNAERFGLSQLHQLRGRIGRGKFQSYCILISEQKTEEAQARLEAMLNTDDGFKIAEEDMAIRGTGEVFGTRQHGMPELQLANLVEDIEILEQARKEAFELINIDPNLQNPRNKLLKQRLADKFKDTFRFGLTG